MQLTLVHCTLQAVIPLQHCSISLQTLGRMWVGSGLEGCRHWAGSRHRWHWMQQDPGTGPFRQKHPFSSQATPHTTPNHLGRPGNNFLLCDPSGYCVLFQKTKNGPNILGYAMDNPQFWDGERTLNFVMFWTFLNCLKSIVNRSFRRLNWWVVKSGQAHLKTLLTHGITDIWTVN